MWGALSRQDDWGTAAQMDGGGSDTFDLELVCGEVWSYCAGLSDSRWLR